MIWADEIAQAVRREYDQLSQRGKPQGKEVTVLAAVVVERRKGDFEVLSLGTGSKCIGGLCNRCLEGETLNDSHAEVIARRAFTVWLYGALTCLFDERDNVATEEAEKTASRKRKGEYLSDVLELVPSREGQQQGKRTRLAQVKAGVKFHLFTTKSPCGCASDLLAPFDEAVRKPGRGEETLSMSCTDKLAKWSIMGIQGAFLMQFLVKPIYLSSIIIASEGVECIDRARRALSERLRTFVSNAFDSQSLEPFQYNCIEVLILRDAFEGPFVAKEHSVQSGTSINWLQGYGGHEATLAATGRKLGTAKRKDGKPLSKKTRSRLCKASVLKLMSVLAPDDGEASSLNSGSRKTYKTVKHGDSRYQSVWKAILDHRETPLKKWTRKPDAFEDFEIEEVHVDDAVEKTKSISVCGLKRPRK